MNLVLSHFDSIIGPRIFISNPKPIDSDISRIILDLMDINHENVFFEYRNLEKTNKTFINFIFRIESEWARGEKELLMLTSIVDKNLELSFVQFNMKNIIDKLKGDSNIYMGFYEDRKGDDKIEYEKNKICTIMKHGFKVLQSKYNQIAIVDRIFDENEKNGIDSSGKILQTMARTFITCIDSQVPEGAVLLYDIGSILADKFDPFFKSSELDVLLGQLSKFWKKYNFGIIDEVKLQNSTLKFSVYDCFECCHYPNISTTVCKFDEGFLAKTMSKNLNKQVEVKEIECYATGHDHCRFKVKIL